ncbi:cuticle protein CP1499-like [Penaeus japonicus]|uniref:cuticle protein CP1499-like n=1 Tax=Penaeus japonicus TaxID=27405 RepID=UPI001C716ECB|nr:cuticle protein CP1499-like [Penaeus japonicus]
MKTLVVLAVLGVCSASPRQAYNYGYNYGQPGYVGPVAATVPAGVDGTITPVSDTYEVAAARDAFFRAYQAQLAAVGALRYGTPAAHYAVPTAVHHSVPVVHHTAAAVHHGVPAGHYVGPVAYQTALGGGVPGPVRDTLEVSAAKAEFFRLYNLQAAAAAAAPDHHAHYDY